MRTRSNGRHTARTPESMLDAPSVSVKLSALHPRYESAQRASVCDELDAALTELASRAEAEIGISVDAEEAIFSSCRWISANLHATRARSLRRPRSRRSGYGSAPYRDRWSAHSHATAGDFPVRLVKGAYWDARSSARRKGPRRTSPCSRRKRTQTSAYLACAERLLAEHDSLFYLQFATHNAHTVSRCSRWRSGPGSNSSACTAWARSSMAS